jgi:hypothetical protein
MDSAGQSRGTEPEQPSPEAKPITLQNESAAPDIQPSSLGKEVDWEKEKRPIESDQASTTTEPGSINPAPPGRKSGYLKSCLKVLTWMPKNARYDTENPPKFSMSMNFLYAVVS